MLDKIAGAAAVGAIVENDRAAKAEPSSPLSPRSSDDRGTSPFKPIGQPAAVVMRRLEQMFRDRARNG